MNHNRPEKAGFMEVREELAAGQVVFWVGVLNRRVWAVASAVRPIIGMIHQTGRLLLDFLIRTRRCIDRQSTGL